MQIVDTGVLTPSFMDFSLPSEFAKSALYYCPQFGQFICNSDYRIERNGIDQYLLCPALRNRFILSMPHVLGVHPQRYRAVIQ